MAEYLEELDLYRVEDLYTDEEKLVRNTVREFVGEEILPIAAEHWEAGTFPSSLVRGMGELGMFGANIQGYGCAGVSETAYGLIMQELERGDSGVRSFASVQGALVMYPIHRYGSEEQRLRWLPRLAAGEAVGCFGLTEAGHGSNPGGMETRARRDGGHWVIQGSKMWITNGSSADVAVVWARTREGIRGFLVEAGSPGFSARKTERKWSMRMSDTSELFLDDCRVPEENRLPGAAGLRAPLTCLNQARYGIAWGVVGAAQACLLEALAYTRERTQFGVPIASFQMIQDKLAEHATQITLAQVANCRMAKLKEAGDLNDVQISLAKRNQVRMALECARAMRDLMGAAGIVHDHSIGRHMCNLESVLTYEGTHNIHTLVLGAHLTGMQAFAGTRPVSPDGGPGGGDEERRKAWDKRRKPAVAE
jgi:glutaryl-CoA dehydrogenase